ncbi:MAG: ATP-grasp domain-containing protein [Candidatus Omnitrophica bacterium]|nr:ATP-grasp domain-containing protein [Candidatus Omnitrophota bacterium]
MKINLLIPDAESHMAYFVILGMKDVCHKIVTAIPNMGKFSRLYAFSSCSRYVHKSYRIVNITHDWIMGTLDKGERKDEETFINEIIDICKKEEINVIYPSKDYMLYIFSKHLDRFTHMGITIPVVKHSTIMSIINKHTMNIHAKEAGIACPKTFLVEHISTLERAVSELSFPVIFKPCFGENGINIHKVYNKDELFNTYHDITNVPGKFMVQEYIPGNEFISINSFISDKNNLNLSLFYKEQTLEIKIYPTDVLAYEHLSISRIDDAISVLFKALGYIGYSNLQLKVDSRDNIPKLLDFNPRINYSAYLVMAWGINAPFIHYQIYKKEKITLNVAVGHYEINTICPLRELCIIVIYLWCVLVKLYYALNPVKQVNPFKNVPSLIDVMRFYRKRYFTRRKTISSPYVKSLINDPLVGIFFLISCFTIACKKYPDDFMT